MWKVSSCKIILFQFNKSATVCLLYFLLFSGLFLKLVFSSNDVQEVILYCHRSSNHWHLFEREQLLNPEHFNLLL